MTNHWAISRKHLTELLYLTNFKRKERRELIISQLWHKEIIKAKGKTFKQEHKIGKLLSIYILPIKVGNNQLVSIYALRRVGRVEKT